MALLVRNSMPVSRPMIKTSRNARPSIRVTQVRAQHIEARDIYRPAATRFVAGIGAALVLAIGGTTAVAVQPADAHIVRSLQVATVPSDALLGDFAKKCAGCDPTGESKDLPEKALAEAEQESKNSGSPESPSNAIPDAGGPIVGTVNKVKEATQK